MNQARKRKGTGLKPGLARTKVQRVTETESQSPASNEVLPHALDLSEEDPGGESRPSRCTLSGHSRTSSPRPSIEDRVPNDDQMDSHDAAENVSMADKEANQCLSITADEGLTAVRQAGKKKGGAKKKRGTAECEGVSEPPELEIDSELDRELENKSRQHRLTSANVRSIIHEVITNEHVVAMMKAAINETEPVPVFEPKMTRSKLKEVVEKGVVIPTWAISPIKKPSEAKAPQFVDIPLEEEDSSDEEYHPDEEEEDETAEDTLLESDLESTSSSPRGSRANLHRMQVERNEDRSSSAYQASGRSKHLRVEVVPMGPPPPPKDPVLTRPSAECSFMEKLHAVDEELASATGTDCMETYQSLSADGGAGGSMMAFRTRSKRPLRDIPLEELEAELRAPDITPDMYDSGSALEDREWTQWLQGLMSADMDNEEEEGDDEDDDDPEYNFLADIDEPDLEDYRNDRAVRITKKEVNELMEELFETFQDELGVEEQEEEGQEEEDEREEETPQPAAHSLSIVQTVPYEDPLADVLNERYRTVKEQLAALRRRRAALQSQGVQLPTPHCEPPPSPKPPSPMILTHPQKLHLQQQIQQHVQLLTQASMLTTPVEALKAEATTTKQFLTELKVFAQCGEQTRRVVEPDFISIFRVCNLEGALSLLDELEKCPLPASKPAGRYPVMPAHLAWLMATRPMFLYPELLPLVSLDPILHPPRSNKGFTHGEDCLIVLGLQNFGETPRPLKMVAHYLLGAKDPSEVKKHIYDVCHSTSNNIIKVYFLHKRVPVLPRVCRKVMPHDQHPPVERDEDFMPRWLWKSLQVIYQAVQLYNAPPTEDSHHNPNISKILHSKKDTHPISTQGPTIQTVLPQPQPRLYNFPAGTQYPPALPEKITLHACGFKWIQTSATTLKPEGRARVTRPKCSTRVRNATQSQERKNVHIKPATTEPSAPSGLSVKDRTQLQVSGVTNVKQGLGVNDCTSNLPTVCPTAHIVPSHSGWTQVTPQASPLVKSFVGQHKTLIRLHPLLPRPSHQSVPTVLQNNRTQFVLLPQRVLVSNGCLMGSFTNLNLPQAEKPAETLSRRRARKTRHIAKEVEEEMLYQTQAKNNDDDVEEEEDEGPEPEKSSTRVDEEDDDGCEGGFTVPFLTLSESSGSPAASMDGFTGPTSPDESLTSSPQLEDVAREAEGGHHGDKREAEMTEKQSVLRSEKESDAEQDSSVRGSAGLQTSSCPSSTCHQQQQHHEEPAHPPSDSKNVAIAHAYLERVCRALQGVPGKVEEFLGVLYTFEHNPEGRTSVELYTQLKLVLKDWPELLQDFAAFLHPKQAQECGLLEEQKAFERSRTFLHKLEQTLGENSSDYRMVVAALQGDPSAADPDIDQVRSQISSLLRGHKNLEKEFWGFFNQLHYKQSQPVRSTLREEESNKTPAIHLKLSKSAPHADALEVGTNTALSKVGKGGYGESEDQDRPKGDSDWKTICAKNISRMPSGEKVVLWTREADRLILTACQQKGATPKTFLSVSVQLGNKTDEEVCARFQDLMKLYHTSTKQQRSRDRDTNTDSSKAEEPD
ncbi:GON-4-like protein isoform X2 [Denticeps clupeoides]|uniref:GON-4-like protein n=1 Tax=Denticeps clupeoides TaxID=299321 RepID=A0AAY4E6R8_9TELE|nr:GON-4-like protein isoform X2 [Denticeps clupeoides]